MLPSTLPGVARMQKLALSLSLCLFAACAVQRRPQQPQNPTPAPTQQSPQQPQNPTPAPTQQNPQQPKPTPAPTQQKPAEQKPADAKQGEQKPGEPAKPGAQGQEPAKTAIPPEKLEQLVAPIALYPDGLLSQTLMASTYPLDIVQAARWLEKNPNLKSDALEKALQDKDWDPSVKALCGLPTVVKKMNDNLDWTQDLGDAFLADQSALMDTVQKMRRKAKDAGKLETTKEQKVSEREDKIIVIEPADPQTVYVPTYYPTACYGSWSYPVYYYPPMYPAYPPAYPAFTFAVGVAWGAAIWGGCSWGWGHSECNVNSNNDNNFPGRTENNFNRDRVQQRPTAGNNAGNNRWQHNSANRKGVRYGDKATADRYKPSTSDRSARGYGQDRAGTRPSSGATRPSTGNPPAGTRPSTGSTRPSSGSTKPSTSQSGSRSGSFSGSRSPSADRAASQRGSSSRGSSSRGGASRGGGSRGGGGGRGGGGRR